MSNLCYYTTMPFKFFLQIQATGLSSFTSEHLSHQVFFKKVNGYMFYSYIFKPCFISNKYLSFWVAIKLNTCVVLFSQHDIASFPFRAGIHGITPEHSLPIRVSTVVVFPNITVVMVVGSSHWPHLTRQTTWSCICCASIWCSIIRNYI